MERRKNVRVPFEVTAAVNNAQAGISGMVCDLSMKGMFLATNQKAAEGDVLNISIMLSGASSTVAIEFKGKVIRQTESGIAVEFQEMDLDSFTHLRNIIAQNCDDPDILFKEYFPSLRSK